MNDAEPSMAPALSNPRSPGRRKLFATAFAVGFEISLLGVAAIAGEFVGEAPLETIAWNSHDAAKGALATIAPLLVFWWMIRSQLAPLRRIREILDVALRPFLGDCEIWRLAAIAVAAGVGEEALFRGVLQAWLSRTLGAGIGVALASILFGLVHAVTPAYFVFATAMGAYLGVCWLQTGNLLTPIVIHSLYDFVAIAAFFRMSPLEAPTAIDDGVV